MVDKNVNFINIMTETASRTIFSTKNFTELIYTVKPVWMPFY